MKHLLKLLLLVNEKTKKKLMFLVVFSILLSIIETIGISAIMPFIDIAINFDNILKNQYYKYVFDFFGYEKQVNFAISFGLFLIGFYILRGAMNLAFTYLMAKFSEEFYAQTIQKLFKVFMQMPYSSFTRMNSSYLTKTIITEASLMATVLKAVLLAISEIFVLIFIYGLMMLVSWKITIILTIILLVKLIFLKKTVFKSIENIGLIRANTHAEIYEIVNRLFGNFKSIKLQDRKRHNETQGEFSQAVKKYSNANVMHNYYNALPRLFLETGGFTLVIFLLISLLYINQTNVSFILPTLSLLILAMYRLLPSLNRIITGYNLLMFHHKAFDIIEENLNTPQEELQDNAISFSKGITLQDVSFSYKGKNILLNINLLIEKGKKVAFVGDSGSGKTTLLDIIIGLNRPNKGQILIDNVALDSSNLQNWRSQIGYISQQIYLFDGTIEDNVTFGRELDSELLEKVLKQANILDFIQSKEGMKTLVGEGGIKLSGGQKQRIAIARALYGEPKILVLDEATSALDNQTEQKIMREIYEISKDKTLFIVAHRLSTIEGCDQVIEIKNKMLNEKKL
jgi:ATP-binding cassette, subfamily B, bacterial PglK